MAVVCLDEESLYLLLICSVDYDARLPYGTVPFEIWEQIPQGLRDRVVACRNDRGVRD